MIPVKVGPFETGGDTSEALDALMKETSPILTLPEHNELTALKDRLNVVYNDGWKEWPNLLGDVRGFARKILLGAASR